MKQKAKLKRIFSGLTALTMFAGLLTTLSIATAINVAIAPPALAISPSVINYPDFSNISGLALNGTAAQSGTALRLTPNTNLQKGSAWATSPIDPTSSFSTSFRSSIHDRSGSNQADGIAFVIQSSSAAGMAIGSAGVGIGYSGITPSVAVEFDTFQNGLYDPNNNHVGISTNGSSSGATTTATPSFSMYGSPFTTWIDYNAITKSLRVFVSQGTTQPITPLLTTTVDLAATLGTTNPALVGFTSSTGSENAYHDLLSWSYGGAVGGLLTPEELRGGVNPAQNCECSHNQATSYPIDTSSGNFWHTFDDILIPGRGVPLSLSRTYNSNAASTNSAFGYGWSFNYGLSLTIAGSVATVNQENGSTVTFTEVTPGNFVAPPRTIATLVRNGDGSYTFKRQATEIFNFSSTGLLTSLKDLNNYTTTISRPNSTSMIVTEPAGRTLSFTLSSGRITGVTDPSGRSQSFTYDGSGNLTDVIDVGNGHWVFTYDSSHRLLTMRSPKFYGDVTTTPSPVISNHYDAQGRIDSQTDQLGRTTTFDYTTVPGSTITTDPKGNSTLDTYLNGQLVSQTRAYGTPFAGTWSYSYDPFTLAQTEVTDPNGHVRKMAYDASGNLISETDALNNSASWTYNNLNQPTSSTDANGVMSTATYDSAGNLLTKSSPLITQFGTENEVVTYTYGDPSKPGDVTKITNPLGQATNFTYNTYGDPASITDATGAKTTFTYNTPISIGWLKSQISPKGNLPGANASQYTTTFLHNNYGQVTEARDPLWSLSTPTAHRSINTYDSDRNLISQTDGKGNVTTFTYDAAAQLITTTRPGSITESSTYNLDGSLATQTNGLGKVTSYFYNARGQLTSTVDPLTRSTSYQYDAAGNLKTKIDPSGTCSMPTTGCTTYNYDNADRLTSVDYSDISTPDVSFSYDAKGQRTSMADGTGTSTFSYDSLGRLKSQTNGANVTTNYGYDRANRLTSIGYLGSNSVTRNYDAAGRLISVNDWLGNNNRFTYDPDGNWTSTIYGNGMIQAMNYDRAGQLTSTAINKGTSGNLTYGRDGNGSLTSQSATVLSPSSEAYGYDSLNRLTSVGSTTLTYDNASQITQLLSGDTLAYDDAGQITSKTANSTTTNFTYDTRGNRLTEGSTRSYSYDQANRTKSVTTAGSTSTYTYNDDGLRQSKTANATTTNFTYDISGELPLILNDGTNSYIYGPGNAPIEQISNSNTPSYLHQDQLGSTRVITDQVRSTVATYSYDAYGKQTASTGTGSTPLRYASQYLDAESGLYWMRARYYDPSTAQFTTKDPIWSITREPYGYAMQNPLNGMDPSGMFCVLGKNKNGKCRGSDYVREVAEEVHQKIYEIGSTNKDAVEAVVNFDVGDFDYGTATAGLFNVGYGHLMIYRGGVAMTTGAASVPVFGPIYSTPAIAYGAYSVAGGLARMRRGNDQLSNCISTRIEDSKHQTLGSNVSRFASGVTPAGASEWIDKFGGSAW